MQSIFPIITDYESIERIKINNTKCLLWIVADKQFKNNFELYHNRFSKLNLEGLMISGNNCEEIHDMFDDYFIEHDLIAPITTWHNDKLNDIVFDFLCAIPTVNKDVQRILCLPCYDKKAYFNFLKRFSKASNRYLKKYYF